VLDTNYLFVPVKTYFDNSVSQFAFVPLTLRLV